MKDFLSVNYTFVPGASGVGTLSLGITNFDPKRLVAVINQTRGVMIYSTGSVDLRYSNISGNTLTLFFDTTGHSANDVLQVIYNDPNPLSTSLDNISSWFKTLLKAIQYPNYLDRSLNALRVAITNSLTVGSLPTLGAVTNVATVAAVTDQVNIGGYNAQVMVRSVTRAAWYNSVRPRIS